MTLQTQALITIITPTYNRAHLIRKAINSILEQTYKNWEYVIIDDASTDNTEEIVRSFADPRINFIKCKKNRGNAVARNIGVDAAKGEFIAFLDSDDEYFPNYLEEAYAKLINSSKADFLWSGTRTYTIDGSYTESIWIPKRKQEPNQFLYELHVGIGRGFLINKKCFNNLKFDERLRTAVDTDFLIRLKQNYTYSVLEKVLLSINTQPGSVRSNFSEKKKSYSIIISKHRDIIDKDNYLRFKWYYKLFWLSLYDDDQKLAKEAFHKINKMSYKPLLLKLIFSSFPKKQAVKIHKRLAN